MMFTNINDKKNLINQSEKQSILINNNSILIDETVKTRNILTSDTTSFNIYCRTQ